MAQRSDERLDPADAMLRDRRVDDPADLAVTRFGDLADELLLGRHHHARGPEARLEHLDVLRRRKHVVMTGEEVGARRSPRNRARVAQLGQRLIGHARRGVERVGNHRRHVPMAAEIKRAPRATLWRGPVSL